MENPTSPNAETIEAKSLKTNNQGLSLANAVIKTPRGSVVFKFYPSKAPKTVSRIIQLIQSGFYNDLAFHRVVPDFVVQTGDPQGNGTGGSGQNLKAEFNSIQHIKGTLSMARRSNDVDSADSQFFIALTTLPHLDGQYTAFGQVVEGLSVLDKIAKGDKILSITLNNMIIED